MNFVYDMNQIPVEESIGKMLSELGSKNPTSGEQNDEVDFDNDCYSMGKEKQGKQNPILSLASKVADKKKEAEGERKAEGRQTETAT